MIKQDINNKVALIMTGMLIMAAIAHAKTEPQPLWTYSEPTPSRVIVSDGGSATVTYTVISHTNKPKSLVLQTNPPAPYPSTPGVTASACYLPTKGSMCTLTITINGSEVPTSGIHGGPYLCQADSNGIPNPNQCYQPSATNVLAITKNATQSTSLSVSVSNLALSVTGYTESDVPGTPVSGVARLITVNNTGGNPATHLSLTYPTWPSGTTTTTTCTSTLVAGGTCTITIHPGNTATSDGTAPCTTGVAPTPQSISIGADNASPVSSNVVILGYGCIYQSGYVYAFDDTTVPTESVGGRVVAQTDAAVRFPLGIIWSSNGTSHISYDIIPGIDETSTSSPLNQQPPYAVFEGMFDYPTNNSATYTNSVPNPELAFSTCDGNSDGHCNSVNIMLFYNLYQTNYSTSCDPQNQGTGGCVAITPAVTLLTNYAAGLCYNDTDGGASNGEWYLPAICEMGPGADVVECGATQNMVTNLPDLLGVDNDSGGLSTACRWGNGGMSSTNCLAGYYWSSTEYSGQPKFLAWYEYFDSDPGSFPTNHDKFLHLGVRCSRAF